MADAATGIQRACLHGHSLEPGHAYCPICGIPVTEHQQGPGAGWYADPSGGSGLRYWDGTSWTEQATEQAVPVPVASESAIKRLDAQVAAAQPEPSSLARWWTRLGPVWGTVLAASVVAVVMVVIGLLIRDTETPSVGSDITDSGFGDDRSTSTGPLLDEFSTDTELMQGFVDAGVCREVPDVVEMGTNRHAICIPPELDSGVLQIFIYDTARESQIAFDAGTCNQGMVYARAGRWWAVVLNPAIAATLEQEGAELFNCH